MQTCNYVYCYCISLSNLKGHYIISETGGFCPNCDETGLLHIDEYYVRCDNCDFERFSSQAELDERINNKKLEKDPHAERLITLIEPEPVVELRVSRPVGTKEFEIKR